MVYALRTFGWVRAALRRPRPRQNVCMRLGVRCGGVAEWLKAHSAPEARVPSLKDRVRLGVRCGGVAEWLKAHAWKVCMRETVSRVRIPPPPPMNLLKLSRPTILALKSPEFPQVCWFQPNL